MARVLGLDIGIGSCGWAVVELPEIDEATGEVLGEFAITACGARCFDVPEEPKTKELKNKARRQARGQRRVIRRRRQRIRAIRRLFAAQGLPADPGPLPRGTCGDLVWHLRAAGLDRRLEPAEWARALVHIANHRGFKSNSKRDRDNRSDAGKMLQAVGATDARLAAWRTFGEMLARDQDLAQRRRNRSGSYERTPLRARLEEEVVKLFAAQRRLGNPAASPEFETAYRQFAFLQRPLQTSEELIGPCRFLPAEKRAPRHAPSFERFRFLSRLANLKVCPPSARPRFLTEEERRKAQALFAAQKTVTFKTLRKAIGLPAGTGFDGLPLRKDDPEASRFAEFEGTLALRESLGAARFAELLARSPERLDAAATALIQLDDVDQIRTRLREAGLAADDVAALTSDDGLARFSQFSGTGHISTAACRRLIPHLEAGLVYSDACRNEGWDHAAIGLSRVQDVRNPVVSKILRECTRQIAVVLREVGPVDAVHLEMARDVGKSVEERQEIRKGVDERGAQRERNRDEFEKLLRRRPNDEELLRYELWSEQNHRCPYTFPDEDAYIPPECLLATDNRVQVDHIFPYSRSGDDSFRNKVLCRVSANQEKRRRTPFEWLGEDEERWRLFEARIQGLKQMHPQKRRKLLARAFADRESQYRERHLNDTRYAMRVLRHELEILFPTLGSRRLFPRPGAITFLLRRAWGLDELKKGGALGDRDHALDAIVLACTSEALLNRLTRLHQELEELGTGRATPLVETPLGSSPQARERFRQEVKKAAEAVFVSRPETRRGRGPAHDATLYGFERGTDGEETQYERRNVWELKPADLDRLKGDPARNGTLRSVLAAWLERARQAGIKPEKLWQGDPPRLPNGPPIRRVVLARPSTKAGIKLHRGDAEAHADQASMVRVDVFTKAGRFYLVPVYAWQLVSLASPPMRAIKSLAGENDWYEIDDTFVFLWTIYSGSYLKAVGSDGSEFQGYFRSLDRSNGRVSFSPPSNADSKAQQRFTTKTLKSFLKYHVDRLGRLHRIEKEPRLWHGEVCS
jgi:CRISPR-associated endonuclease Csn1